MWRIKINKISRVMIHTIKFYKKYISRFMLTQCRFYPTCSDYALEAISKYKFSYAIFLVIYRLIRCTIIFFPAGYDPVP
jgi:putative membrane protein insertion efficiency factor